MLRFWFYALALLCALPRSGAADDPPSGGAAAQLPPIEYFYEGSQVRGNDKTRGFFFRNLLDLEAGDRVWVEELDRFRLRLLSTGFFHTVETRLAEGTSPETVLVQVDVEERNSIIVNDVFFGISADGSPFWGGLDLAETNLLGSGMLLAGAFVVSSEQGGLRLNLADPYAAIGLPFAWFVEGRYASAVGRSPIVDALGRPSTLAFEYDRGGGRLGIGLAPLGQFGLDLEYRIETLDFRFLGSDEPLPRTGLVPGRSLLSNLALRLELDQRDRPQLPTSGAHAALILEGGGAFLGSDYEYLRIVGEGDVAIPFRRRHTMRLQAVGGLLLADNERAPYFEGFYIGDISELVAARDLDMQFTDRRSLDLLGNGADLVTYGDLFGRVRAEYAYEITRVFGPLNRVETFASAGLFGIRQGPWDIGRPREAVTSDVGDELGGLHFDLTLNVGLRADTPIGLFELSVGQVLSVAPLD